MRRDVVATLAAMNMETVPPFPASSHSPIVYPVALVAASANPDAVFFVAHLASHAATKILIGQGFDILPKRSSRHIKNR